MNRRTLLKGFAALSAGLILPPTLEENAEAARRFWALGAMPTPHRQRMVSIDPGFDNPFAVWVEQKEPHETRITNWVMSEAQASKIEVGRMYDGHITVTEMTPIF